MATSIIKKWENFFRSCELSSAACSSYAKIFVKERIQPHILSELQKEDLALIGIDKLGDQLAILIKIRERLKEQPANTHEKMEDDKAEEENNDVEMPEVEHIKKDDDIPRKIQMPVENLPKATKIIEKAKKIPKKKLIESSTIDTRDMTLPSKDIALPKALIHVSEKTKIIQKKTSKSSDISLVSILKSKIRSDLVATKEIKTVVKSGKSRSKALESSTKPDKKKIESKIKNNKDGKNVISVCLNEPSTSMNLTMNIKANELPKNKNVLFRSPAKYRESRSDFYQFENWWEDSHVSQPFVDTHCHLDLLYNKEKIELNQINNAKNFSAKIHDKFRGAISILCFPNSYDLGYRLGNNSNSVLGHAVGCHPKAVNVYKHDKMVDFMNMLKNRNKLLAVGECGLDDTSSFSYVEQKAIFIQQVRLAKEMDLPIVIHSRGNSNNDLSLDAIKQGGLNRHHNIHRHCFTYSTDVAYKWMKEFSNMYFGLTPLICSPSCPSDLIKFAREFPLEKIVLETDSPFFSIRPDSNSHPGFALAVAQQIAELRKMNVNNVLERLYLNTKRLYNLKLDD